MNRYPDQIIILEAIGGDPYNAPKWRQVYTGRCRCFLHRESGFRTNKVMDSSHQVVIPDRSMPEIGENFKVGIKMHTNKNNHYWDLVGYVKDFARYDRVCNLNFQMVKENLIYEDTPAPAVDMSHRQIVDFEDGSIHIEGEGLLYNGEQLVSLKPFFVWRTNSEYRFQILASNTDPEIEEEDVVIYEELDDEATVYEGASELIRHICYYTEDDYLGATKNIFIVPLHVALPIPEPEEGKEEEEPIERKPTITFKMHELVHNEETDEDEWVEVYSKAFVIVE